jgi:cation:H+ antiporter
MTFVLFIVGLVLLVVGAEALVNGSARLAAAVGISPLVIGLTIVAFGTSSPELAVGIQAGLRDQADVVVGNVIGSNIFNILFILGLSALITPLLVSQRLTRVDVPLLVGISFLMLFMALDGTFGRLDGLILFLGVIIYTAWSFRQSRKGNEVLEAEYAHDLGLDRVQSSPHWVRYLLLMIVGLAALILGSRWLVDGAVEFARFLGVDELIIGLTIVAIGTSLPEVATAVIATLRDERDIAVGNAVGSNIFNILSVLGFVALIAPNGISVDLRALWFDLPVMIAVALLCVPVFFTRGVIRRWEGALFLGYYVAYTLYLILAASGSAALPLFSTLMVAFVIPLTLLVLWQSFRRSRRAPRVR